MLMVQYSKWSRQGIDLLSPTSLNLTCFITVCRHKHCQATVCSPVVYNSCHKKTLLTPGRWGTLHRIDPQSDLLGSGVWGACIYHIWHTGPHRPVTLTRCAVVLMWLSLYSFTDRRGWSHVLSGFYQVVRAEDQTLNKKRSLQIA